MKLYLKTKISRNYREIFARFNLELFKALKPPLMNLIVERFDGCKKGDEVHLHMNVFGQLDQKWISHITANDENDSEIYFIDEGALLPPPLNYWKHIHRINKIDETTSYVIDDIEYTTGNSLLDALIFPALYSMFLFRKPVYRRELN